MPEYADERVLANATNRRQARRIRSVRDPAALHAEYLQGRDLWVKGTDEGLYVVRYGPGGGLTVGDHRTPGQIALLLEDSQEDSIEVVHDADDQPEAVRRANWGDGS